jgi:hypothetical protein
MAGRLLGEQDEDREPVAAWYDCSDEAVDVDQDEDERSGRAGIVETLSLDPTGVMGALDDWAELARVAVDAGYDVYDEQP